MDNLSTTLGNRGYTVLKEELNTSVLNNIRRDLTVKPFINTDYGAEANPFPLYAESKRKLYLPRYYGYHNFGKPVLNKLSKGDDIDIEFKANLKPKQEPIVKAYLDATKNAGGGIIAVPCGYGKTVIALYIAAMLKKKTIVIVHKEFLVNQWKERIGQFLPDARVGRIQGNVVKIDDKDIVIGMLQSISMREYPEDTFKSFGLVIYDECHHLGAEVFSKSLSKTICNYTLGLSATPKRTDGLSKVFEWSLGKIVFSIKKREQEDVDVKIINYFDSNPEYSKEIVNFKNKPSMATMINNICQYQPRTKFICEEILRCCEDERKILLLSDRRDHLKDIKTILDDTQDKYTTGYYLGGMKARDLEETEECDVILGTFIMASEGFDCKYPLNTIILSSPKTNIEQSVGRILRQDPNKRKKVPLIIDMVDTFSMFTKQGSKREKFYNKNNYNITKYELTNGEFKQLDYQPECKKKGKKNKTVELDFLE